MIKKYSMVHFFGVLLFAKFEMFKSLEVSVMTDLSILSTAFENVTSEMFKLHKRNSIINFGLGNELAEVLVLEHLKGKYQPFELKRFTIKDEETVEVIDSAILMFDSVLLLYDFNNKSQLTNMFPKAFTFFVYCQNTTLNEVLALKYKSIFMRDQRVLQQNKIETTANEMTDILQYEYFIIEEEFYIRIMTFIWYSPEMCSEPQLIEVNRFDKSIRKWLKKTFIIEKFQNFHGCELVFGIRAQGVSGDYTILGDEIFKTFGYNLKIAEELSRSLNYVAMYNPEYSDGSFFDEYLLVDFVFSLGSINEHYYYSQSNQKPPFYTYPYIFLPNTMIVPPGQEYNTYEKLLLPFDLATWALILFTLLAAFLTIIIVSLTTKSIRDFVFGSNIASPSLNVAMIFFGSPQFNLPKHNFARFLTMLFVLYSMIIRTAWQGKMFEFMQKKMTKDAVRSVDEMIEKNFTFYMLPAFKSIYEEMDFMKR